MDWDDPCIIGKLLELRCLKWACMTHLDIWNTSYGQNKGWEWNWQFDARPPKVKNRPDLLVYRWRATYHWKDFDEGYNFASDLIPIVGLHTKLWAPNVAEVPAVGVPWQNAIWMLVPWLGTKYIIRGKVTASPKSRPWWVLWIWICPWLVLA